MALAVKCGKRCRLIACPCSLITDPLQLPALSYAHNRKEKCKRHLSSVILLEDCRTSCFKLDSRSLRRNDVIGPQGIDVVEFACLAYEYVHHEFPVVEHDPAPLG